MSWSRRVVPILALIAASAGCSSPPGPDVAAPPTTSGFTATGSGPTGSPTVASAGATATSDGGGPGPTGFNGDLRTLLAAAPAQAVAGPAAGTADGQADVDVMASTFSYAAPGPYAQRLEDLGFQQGAAFLWRLSQQNFATVRLIQFRDEAAARQWFADQSQKSRAQPLDSTTFQGLNLPAEFDAGAHGAWFVGQPVHGEEGSSRTVSAVFYRHEIVVDINLTLVDDGQLAPMADFARAQYVRLP